LGKTFVERFLRRRHLTLVIMILNGLILF